jgi:hypothetical protein
VSLSAFVLVDAILLIGNHTISEYLPHIKHVSITTTSEYIEIDMAMKRKAIERCPPLVPDPEGETRWHASKDIIQWLEDL